MHGLWTIYRREISGLFMRPLAWILLCLALWCTGFFFVLSLQDFQGDVTETMRFSLGGSIPFWFLLIVLPPLLTMRMISEESRGGMLEFLLTAPVSDAAVVVGKFLAATTVMAIVWSAFLVYGILLSSLGAAPDWLPLISGVGGAIMTSALFCSIGILCSALTNTPMLALFFALIFNTFFYFLPRAASLLDNALLERVIKSVDIHRHFYESFNLGILDTGPITFFLAWTTLFVFIAVRRIEMRRWS